VNAIEVEMQIIRSCSKNELLGQKQAWRHLLLGKPVQDFAGRVKG
jgi:hypothetical protein